MNNSTKRQLSRVTCIAAVIGIFVCFSRVIPKGINGEIHEVIPFVVVGGLLFLVAIPAAIMSQYYKAKPDDYDQLTVLRTEVTALGEVGKERLVSEDDKQPESK